MNNIPEDSTLRRHYLTELKFKQQENFESFIAATQSQPNDDISKLGIMYNVHGSHAQKPQAPENTIVSEHNDVLGRSLVFITAFFIFGLLIVL